MPVGKKLCKKSFFKYSPALFYFCVISKVTKARPSSLSAYYVASYRIRFELVATHYSQSTNGNERDKTPRNFSDPIKRLERETDRQTQIDTYRQIGRAHI